MPHSNQGDTFMYMLGGQRTIPSKSTPDTNAMAEMLSTVSARIAHPSQCSATHVWCGMAHGQRDAAQCGAWRVARGVKRCA
eukprot:15463861-Alexandrium_andersonii.AAC.1